MCGGRGNKRKKRPLIFHHLTRVDKISTVVYIALGSNKGNREDNLRKAAAELNTVPDCRITAKSSVYEAKPYGSVKQDNFLNAVISVETGLWLKKLFFFLKEIEKKLGRTVTKKWGPREIDLDLLFFDKTIYSDFELNVPHPGIMERDFVIVPFSEIAPDFIYPGQEIRISDVDLNTIEKNIITKTDYKL